MHINEVFICSEFTIDNTICQSSIVVFFTVIKLLVYTSMDTFISTKRIYNSTVIKTGLSDISQIIFNHIQIENLQAWYLKTYSLLLRTYFNICVMFLIKQYIYQSYYYHNITHTFIQFVPQFSVSYDLKVIRKKETQLHSIQNIPSSLVYRMYLKEVQQISKLIIVFKLDTSLFSSLT